MGYRREEKVTNFRAMIPWLFPIVVIRSARACGICVCVWRGADVDYRKLCKGENQCIRNRTSGGAKEIKGDKERRKACGKKEKDDSSRNTEREESFPGRCLAPNCMPESDCISSSFSLPFSPSLLHSRSSSLARWVFASSPCPPPPNSTPLRKRGIRNVIAPLREISCYDPVAIPLHSLLLYPRRRAFGKGGEQVYYVLGWRSSAILSTGTLISSNKKERNTQRRRTKVVREGSFFLFF